MSEKRREIKVPPAQLWREFRMRYLPVGVFAAALGAAAMLWQQAVVGPTLVGEVETTQARIISPDQGVITNVLVRPYQIVKAGEPVAELLSTSVRVMSGQVQNFQNRIAMSQLELRSAVDQERMDLDYQAFSMNMLRFKADVAAARSELPTLESAAARAEQGWKDKVVPYNDYESALRQRDTVQARVVELERLVQEAEQRLKQSGYNAAAFTNRTALAALPGVLEALDKERHELEEIRREALVLRAPIDGVVGAVMKQSGEVVLAGDLIMTIHARQSDRIVAYIRQGSSFIPTNGMPVKVRCRSMSREEAVGRVEEIGFYYQPITKPALLRSGASFEMGMPIAVTMPPSLRLILRPGEIVDLALPQ
jgi:membrane fusion protein, multidrug efflux system